MPRFPTPRPRSMGALRLRSGQAGEHGNIRIGTLVLEAGDRRMQMAAEENAEVEMVTSPPAPLRLRRGE